MAVRNYGHLQGVTQLAFDNGISLTQEVSAGDKLKVNKQVSFDLPVVTIQQQTTIAPNQLIVEPWQNIFDIAVQAYGDLSGLVNLTADNLKSLTGNIVPGETLKTRNVVINKLVVDFIKGKGIKIATGLAPEKDAELKPEGIEYWAIEYDFIVS